jgi:uncharacterized protein YggT (Ycf19 family)
MPIEKEVTTTHSNSGPAAEQVTQTSSVSKVPTGGEVKDAQADRGNAWIWYLVGLVDLLLALRIVFKLLGARAVGFADLLYGITDPLIAPFRGIFASPQIEGAYFDTASLVAIIVYALLGWGVSRLIDLVTRPATSEKV